MKGLCMEARDSVKRGFHFCWCSMGTRGNMKKDIRKAENCWGLMGWLQLSQKEHNLSPSVSLTEQTYLEVNIILCSSFTLEKKLLLQMKNYTMIKKKPAIKLNFCCTVPQVQSWELCWGSGKNTPMVFCTVCRLNWPGSFCVSIKSSILSQRDIYTSSFKRDMKPLTANDWLLKANWLNFVTNSPYAITAL